MRQYGKKAIKEAERLGYEYIRTNASNFDIYAHPLAGEIAINPSMDEAAGRNVIRAMQKAVGAFVPKPGRNAVAVKERTAKAAEIEALRLRAERRRIEEQRDSYLRRIAGRTLTRFNREELARIEKRLAEVRELERLMVDVPASADHRGTGQARHRSGAA